MEGGPKEGPSPWKSLLAGGCAGAVSRTVTSPLERLKILYQIQGVGQSKYQGVFHSLLMIGKEEGWRGYLKGNGTNVLRIFPYSAIQFAAYERYKIWFSNAAGGDLTAQLRFLSGALAGVTSVIATYPLDLVRTRLSAQRDAQYSGIGHAFRHIYTREGVLAFYRGIAPTLLGIVPYVGINFMAYETLKLFIKRRVNPEPTTVQLLMCGGLAGAIGQTVTYPLDLLRRRMQVQGFTPENPVYGTTWNAVKTIALSEGFFGFYKGLIPNYLKVVPAVAVSFVVYEKTVAFLKPL